MDTSRLFGICAQPLVRRSSETMPIRSEVHGPNLARIGDGDFERARTKHRGPVPGLNVEIRILINIQMKMWIWIHRSTKMLFHYFDDSFGRGR